MMIKLNNTKTRYGMWKKKKKEKEKWESLMLLSDK